MKHNSCILAALASLSATLAPAAALAGGLSISEGYSTAAGRAWAAATYPDLGAIIYNPSLMSKLDGFQAAVGASLIIPGFKYKGADGTSGETKMELTPPPNFLMAYNVGSQTGDDHFVAGLAYWIPYGSGMAWPDNWVGRGYAQKSVLSVMEIAPTLAWRYKDTFAFGASLRILPGSVYLKQAVLFADQAEGTLEGSGSGTGYGARAAVTVWPIEKLTLALVWQSAASVKMKGDADFDFPAPFDAQAVDGSIETTIPLDQEIKLAVGYDVMPELHVSADLEWDGWSRYKALNIKITSPDGSTREQSQVRDSSDGWVVHAGGEYKLSDALSLRAGYCYDRNTTPELRVSPAPPDSDKHIVTLGASYYWDRFGFHLHGENIFFTERETAQNEMPGTWSGRFPGGTMAYIFGMDISVKLDAPAAIEPKGSN